MIRLKINGAFIIVIISICFFVLSHKSNMAQEENFIKPGIGVGKLRLRDSVENVNKIINRRYDDIKRVGQEPNFEMWLSYKNIGLTLIYSYDAKKLIRIVARNKALFVENTRISVGSSVADLRQYEKKNKDKDIIKVPADEKRNIATWDFVGLGVKFWIDWNDQKIFAIEVKEKRGD